MSAAQTVYVDDLIDRQQLTGRTYLQLGLLLVALLCDGFDLQLVGVAAPWLADAWNLKPSQLVGPVQSANLFGMMLGAIFLGGLGDRLGQIAPGFRADFAAWSIDTPDELGYWIGFNPCSMVVRGGEIALERNA